MALVNVASKLPMSVIITSNPPAEGQDPLYSHEIVGERDPGAVGGWGITYDVEDTAYNDWTAIHADQAALMKIVTQADIDAMADTTDEYGYELGLDDAGGTRAGREIDKTGEHGFGLLRDDGTKRRVNERGPGQYPHKGEKDEAEEARGQSGVAGAAGEGARKPVGQAPKAPVQKTPEHPDAAARTAHEAAAAKAAHEAAHKHDA